MSGGEPIDAYAAVAVATMFLKPVMSGAKAVGEKVRRGRGRGIGRLPGVMERAMVVRSVERVVILLMLAITDWC